MKRLPSFYRVLTRTAENGAVYLVLPSFDSYGRKWSCLPSFTEFSFFFFFFFLRLPFRVRLRKEKKRIEKKKKKEGAPPSPQQSPLIESTLMDSNRP